MEKRSNYPKDKIKIAGEPKRNLFPNLTEQAKNDLLGYLDSLCIKKENENPTISQQIIDRRIRKLLRPTLEDGCFPKGQQADKDMEELDCFPAQIMTYIGDYALKMKVEQQRKRERPAH